MYDYRDDRWLIMKTNDEDDDIYSNNNDDRWQGW